MMTTRKAFRRIALLLATVVVLTCLAIPVSASILDEIDVIILDGSDEGESLVVDEPSQDELEEDDEEFTVDKEVSDDEDLDVENGHENQQGSKPEEDPFYERESDIISNEDSEAVYVPAQRLTDTLPERVDLSEDKYFPPIITQLYGSCASYPATYYGFTYQVARLNDWDAKSDPYYRFSPKWTYNYVGDGEGDGTSAISHYKVLSDIGAARITEFDFDLSNYPLDIREWSSDIDIMRNALKTRVSEYHTEFFANLNEETPITGPNSEALINMKSLLSSGHILGFSFPYGKDIQVSTEQGIAIKRFEQRDGGYTAHALAIVGYDDTISYDINGNGVIEEFEKGAFKVANSNGTRYGNEGFIWILYDSLNKVSNADDEHTSLNSSVMRNYTYRWMEVENYENEFVVEITVNSAKRKDIKVLLGEQQSSQIYWTFLNGQHVIGNYAFDGSDQASEQTFIFDFDPGIPKELWENGIPYITLYNNSSQDEGAYISDIKFRRDGDVVAHYSPNVYLTNGNISFYHSWNPVLPEEVTLSMTNLELTAGYEQQLIATVLPQNATNKFVSWSSSDESIAKVDFDGKIKGIQAGVTTITAQSLNGHVANCIVTVNESGQPESIEVQPNSISIQSGERKALEATILPSNVNRSLLWRSENLEVATVDQNGMVVGVSNGNTTVSATTSNGLIATCEVAVEGKPLAERVKINTSEVYLAPGYSQQLSASVYPLEAEQTVQWVTMQSNITLSESGVVTAINPGRALAQAHAINYNELGETILDVININVIEPENKIYPTNMYIETQEITLANSVGMNLNLIIEPENANQSVTWNTSDSDVVRVDQDGRVVGIKPDHSAVITATALNGLTAECVVNVEQRATSISIIPDGAIITPGSSLQLTSIAYPENADQSAISWRSENPSIAQVDSNGLITAITTGTVNIVATWSKFNYSASTKCNITVVDELPAIPLKSIVSGYGASLLVLKTDGSMAGWGMNNSGQLGNGSFDKVNNVEEISNNLKIVDIAYGYNHALALDEYGSVWSWGNNGNGQLGDGTYTNRNIPINVEGINDVIKVAAGTSHSIALKSDGTVWTWGNNNKGQLGIGSIINSSIPVQVSDLSDIIDIDASNLYSIAICADGTVWAWGDNTYGQLGNGVSGSNKFENVPTQVYELINITKISAGYLHVLALDSDGTAWAWGYNAFGQLGDNTYTQKNTPVLVQNISDVVYITAGQYMSMAIKSDGTVLSWGYNNKGQLGDGTTINRIEPVLIDTLQDVISITSGGTFSSAVDKNGTVYAWGENSYGVLGDGETTSSLIPAICNI